MKKKYIQVTLKNRDKVNIPEDKWPPIQGAWHEIKRGKLASYPIDLDGDVSFDARNIEYSKPVWVDEYSGESGLLLPAPEMSHYERQKNIRRMKIYNVGMKVGAEEKRTKERMAKDGDTFEPREIPYSDDQLEQKWFDEARMYVRDGVYPDTDSRHGKFTREEWNSARGIFFDVLFDSQEHEHCTVRLAIEQMHPNQDPREFDRDKLVRDGREKAESLVEKAKKIFGIGED